MAHRSIHQVRAVIESVPISAGRCLSYITWGKFIVMSFEIGVWVYSYETKQLGKVIPHDPS